MTNTTPRFGDLLVDLHGSSLAVYDSSGGPACLVLRLPFGGWRSGELVCDHVGPLVRRLGARHVVLAARDCVPAVDERMVLTALLRLRAEYGFELTQRRTAPVYRSDAPFL